MLTRFMHVCLVSAALTSVTLLFVLAPVTSPPAAWLIDETSSLGAWPSDEASVTSPPRAWVIDEAPVTSPRAARAIDEEARATDEALLTIPSPARANDEASVIPPSPVDDFHQLIDLTTFQFLLNVESCNNTEMPTLLVLIHSAAQNLEKRNTIRETWGSYLRDKIKIVFLLGKIDNLNAQSKLLQEQYINNDLVQGNFVDKYRNITYKHVMAFKWVKYYCTDVNFILKTDDDVFINMPNLLKFLPALPTSRLIFCDVMKQARAKRTWRSKWRVAYDEYAARVYPDYCAGWAILYTGDVALTLYDTAQKDRSYFWVDDVHVTGVVAQKAQIKHLPSDNWILEDKVSQKILLNNKWPNIYSPSKYLLGPYNTTPDTIRSLWNILINEMSKQRR